MSDHPNFVNTAAKVILVNGIRTPDGTEIFSRHRHDFVGHDDADGNSYFVDGGTDYLRRVGDWDKCEDLSVYYEPDDHEHNATNAVWGTFGKNSDQPLKYKTIREMDTDHIEAVLENCPNIRLVLRTIMQKELAIRGSNTQENDAA